MEEYLESALKRYEQFSSIITIDIDNFKTINNGFGHGEGDKGLIEIADLLNARLRDLDRVCRYGVEEFVLILPNIPQSQA